MERQVVSDEAADEQIRRNIEEVRETKATPEQQRKAQAVVDFLFAADRKLF